jgi:hypothetical protein
MTNGRAVLGVILAAAALACVARLHHVLSHPSSPPQLTEAPQKAGSSGQQQLAAQEFADWPRSIHTVPVFRPPAQPPAAPEPERPMQAPLPRVSAQTDIAATSPSHAPPLDVCARSGGRRVDFMRGHHAMWRCIYPRRR